MSKNKQPILYLFFLVFILSGYCSLAQAPPQSGVKYDKKDDKKGAWKPGNTQQEAEEKKEKDDELKAEPKTKLGKSRRNKKIEKQERKDYYAHQNRIQHPDVRYRMNQNEKKANKHNANKKPNIFRRIGAKLKFKKRKVGR
ncbi:MAG: hypothetical protein IPO21_16065 [Bacteroidales bacterium]|nr:hypothetical protein [Bacteroidales bacterium]